MHQRCHRGALRPTSRQNRNHDLTDWFLTYIKQIAEARCEDGGWLPSDKIGLRHGLIQVSPTTHTEDGVMATFETSLVSPEALVFYGEVEQVDLPGTEGDLGVLAGHAPIVTALRPGIVRLIANGTNEEFVVLGGIAEFSQSILSILADTATPIAEFDALTGSKKWINASRLVRSAMSWIVRSERLITTSAAPIHHGNDCALKSCLLATGGIHDDFRQARAGF